MPHGCEGCISDSCGLGQTQADGGQGLESTFNLQIDQHAAETLHTLPIPWKQDQDAHQLGYVLSCAMDGSDLPCYILWPVRSPEQSFWCIDAWKGDWVRLDGCDHMASLGIEH